MLAETFLPIADDFKRTAVEHEQMKNDIDMLKRVVTDHREHLQRIS